MEPPTLQEELNRKSLDALEELLLGRVSGRITEAQFATGLNVLWTVASGLVSKEFFELISMAKVDKTSASFLRTTFMLCREHWIMTLVDPNLLTVMVYRNGGSEPKLFQCDSLSDAIQRAKKIHEKAGLSGYFILN